jgi:hypothetical protein
MKAFVSTKEVTPEVLEGWRKEWQLAGLDRVRTLLQEDRPGNRTHPLIHDDSFPRNTKRRKAKGWVKDQVMQAEADRRSAKRHSWVSTIGTIVGGVVALISGLHPGK